MKSAFNSLHKFFLILAIGFTLSFTQSCGSDDDDDTGAAYSEVTSGTWKLVSWDGSQCDWGEYLKFSGSTLYWNNRMGGENTTYTFRRTAYGFDCSNSDESYSFVVVSHNNNRMTTASDDGIVREWKR